jgi:6-phosphogluconolactonase
MNGPGPKPKFVICEDAEGVARAGADLFVRQVDSAVRARGRAAVALSGGSTPKRMYELLATEPWKGKVQWHLVHVFWGDERCVPPSDRASNYGMSSLALLDQVPIPGGNVHRIPAELSPPKLAASQYEADMRRYFGDSEPVFDLVLLGLGTNAHTASLFPNTPALSITDRWVAYNFIEEIQMCRITLTAPVLNAGRAVAFLVTGQEKAEVVRDVLYGDFDSQNKPAQLIRPTGEFLWVLDKAAASKLPG